MDDYPDWKTIGNKADLVPGSGIGARVGRDQVALFWIPELGNRVFGISNLCPFSGVHILARGIVGDLAGDPVVASPLYKQHFSLTDGHCIEKPEVVIRTWDVRLEGDNVQVQSRKQEELAA